MTEEDVKKGNIKMTVFDNFPVAEITRISKAMQKLGYKSIIVSNGNIVFQLVDRKPSQEFEDVEALKK